MFKTKRMLKGLAFTTVLALSLVATSAPAFAAQTRGDDSALVSKGKGNDQGQQQGGPLQGTGVTWGGSFTALGITWE